MDSSDLSPRRWRTWNVRSVLAHVRMPEAFGVQLGFFEFAECKYLRECLIGRPPEKGRATTANDLTGTEEVHSEPRLVDAAYTRLRIRWRDAEVDVQSAQDGEDLLLLVEPVHVPMAPVLLTVEAGALWDRPGGAARSGDLLFLRAPGVETAVQATERPVRAGQFPAVGAHLAFRLDRPIGICTGRARSLDEIRAGLDAGRRARDAALGRYGTQAELAGALSSALGWTTVYNAAEDRLTTVCSRVWASRNGGGILFCWDTFFAAMMAAALGEAGAARAYADAIVDTIRLNGYVPNVHNAVGGEALGQSQPPVGAMSLRYVADALDQPDFAAPYLDALLAWSGFWPERRDVDGFLCWGSNRQPPRVGTRYESIPGNLQGARFESGLDNSPMYDDAAFDERRGIMRLADVGLMSLYVRDSLELAELLRRAGRASEAAGVAARADRYARKLDELWDERTGLYLNRDLAAGAPSPRRSPTLFYPLLTGAVSPERAQRMVREHLLNPAEFWGDHVLPSISRDDPAFADQNYWRGRIWAPMNFLVYWGLKQAACGDAAARLAEASSSLFLRAWRRRGHIGENYHAITGETGERANSDPFNPWGALLALVGMAEGGAVPPLTAME
jgi:hypothetical protein